MSLDHRAKNILFEYKLNKYFPEKYFKVISLHVDRYSST